MYTLLPTIPSSCDHLSVIKTVLVPREARVREAKAGMNGMSGGCVIVRQQGGGGGGWWEEGWRMAGIVVAWGQCRQLSSVRLLLA